MIAGVASTLLFKRGILLPSGSKPLHRLSGALRMKRKFFRFSGPLIVVLFTRQACAYAHLNTRFSSANPCPKRSCWYSEKIFSLLSVLPTLRQAANCP
uniref:Uncharacterized protein n=2 Tax=Erwinia amylovora TaxID=552 RepID=E5B695_ERWAM|nr:hypothetical protein predicted by Glimmer/Critica [Erwinia amylovora ATCC BAA-2158]